MSLLNLEDLKRQDSISIPGKGDELRFNCPFCHDTGLHLYVNVKKSLYHCFKCNSSGKISKKQERFLDSFKSLFTKEDKRPDLMIRSLPRNKLIGDIDTPSIYIEYLKSRNLQLNEIIDNNLGFSLDRDGIYSNSIIFPVDNNRYFVARKLYGDPKYVNAPWPKYRSVYLPYQHSDLIEDLVICEGVFDAIRITRVAQSCALLGKEATKEQLQKIVKLPYHGIVIMLDPDAFVQAMKLKIALSNLTDKPIFIAHLKNLDPGDSSEAEILEAIIHADI